MAVDVVLWFILAAAVGLIYCGCVNTVGRGTSVKFADVALEQKLDRAA